MPIHLGLSSEDYQVRYDSVALVFSNHGRHRLYPFLQVGGNCGRGRTKKKCLEAPPLPLARSPEGNEFRVESS